MLDNNEQTQIHHKYNFITELTLVKSSSTQKLNRKLQLADLDENFLRLIERFNLLSRKR